MTKVSMTVNLVFCTDSLKHWYEDGGREELTINAIAKAINNGEVSIEFISSNLTHSDPQTIIVTHKKHE